MEKLRRKPFAAAMGDMWKWIAIVVVFLGLTSCGSQRHILVENLEEKGSPFLLEKMDSSELKYTALEYKFNAKYKKGKKKNDFKGQVRIQKDSLIWVSFSAALGIEVGRLKVTRDSVFFINRLDKEYFKGDFAFMSNLLKTEVDFDMLQALITGNDFTSFEKNDFIADVERYYYTLTNNDRRKIRRALRMNDEDMAYYHKLYLNPSNYKITKVLLQQMGDDKKKLEVEYGNFTPSEDKASMNKQLFPENITFKVSAEDRLNLALKISKVEINDKARFPFKIPKRYNKMLIVNE